MMKRSGSISTLIGALLSLSAIGIAHAGELDDLLRQVKQSKVEETRINKQREGEFLADRKRQKQLLQQAKTDLTAQKKRGKTLKTSFDDNEKKLAELEETLERRQGNLGELFGVVRQVAGDTAGILDNSLVTTQIKNRTSELIRLSNEKKLPSIEEMEEVWFRMQEEMTESGKVSRFRGPVVAVDGTEEQRHITRVGVFNVVSDGKFLQFLPETGQLVELPRQPQDRFLKMAADLEQANSGMKGMAVDPSRGSILGLLVQAPDLKERIQQGKEVGYVIIALALSGFILALYRLVSLSITNIKVKSQLKRDKATKNNPLGRVLLAYFDHKDVDLSTLERKIDEAVLKELPRLERGLSILKTLAIIAPLLGLLGTVTGMIQTFQSITLFGTGDPKLMAGGISQALVTTVLGLMAAIPLTFLHALVSSRSRSVVQVLEEQSAGIIAGHAEEMQ
ncbi:MAG: MotA/TolQ/ExbB proton channel family protein [Pseudomonadota bacterium]